MALKDLFKKFKKKDNKILADDDFCRSDIIFHGEKYLLLLLSYTDNYHQDMVEFLDAESNIDCYPCMIHKIKFSSYDETNESGETISHNRNYMLIGVFDICGFMKIYNFIESVSNKILNTIMTDIINNYEISNMSEANELVNNGIITLCQNPNLDFDLLVCDDGEYLDPNIIKSKAPNVFSGLDILQFVRMQSNYYGYYFAQHAMLEDIDDNMSNVEFKKSVYYNICKKLFKNPSVEKMRMLLRTPLYILPDEDDSLPGDLDDESLDSIFRENYERFSAVADDSTLYEDIDEILEDDEESENMKDEDKM